MKAAISVELDGTRYALDERAFLALRAYLDRASARLGAHPDRVDVIAGLERSIAAKLARRPAARAGVIDEQDMLAALKEVGRVDGPSLEDTDGGDSAAPGGAGRGDAKAPGDTAARAPSSPRRLYRVLKGHKIAGVCTGLATFADVDVNLVRLIFILATLFSGGVWVVAYIVLAFIMPIARTELEIADAQGGPPRS
jgi:phage shock protein PspC (stress-responsive transcriptional regulator)